MRHETTTLAEGGVSTHVNVWTPDSGQPRGLVQVLHGLAEHSARYARLAEALTDVGLAVVAHDHRGHGETCTRGDELGFFAERDGWRAVVSDSARVRAWGRARFPGPWVMFGHSMGTVIALHDLIAHGEAPAGVVLSGATGKVGLLLRIGQGLVQLELRRVGPRGRSKLLNATAFGTYNREFRPNRTEFDWLSRDPAEVDKYIADPKCGFIASASLWRDLLGGQAELQAQSFLARLPRVPYWVFGGDRDPVGGNGRQVAALVEAMHGVGLQVDLQLWPGGRHEMLNETNRAEVLAAVAGWVEGRLPRT